MTQDRPPAIVGAGFSGLSVARFLARAGCHPHIYEEHGKVGFPKHCTGIVSTETIKLIGGPAARCHLHSYHTITIEGSHPPGFSVARKDIAHMLDRVCLEQWMLREAISAGAKYLPNTRVTSVEEQGRKTILKTEKPSTENSHSFTILALGSRPSVLHPLLAQVRRPPIPGVNFVIEAEHSQDPGEIRVFFDHQLAPGFFAWSVPQGSDRLVVGLATQVPSVLRKALEKLVREKLGLNSYHLIEAYGGPVNRGPPLNRLHEGLVLLVGDAAGLVKPVTGGGLYPIAKATELVEREMRCSEAFEVLASRLELIRRELLRHYKVAKLLHNPGNQRLIDKALEIARRESLGELIGERMGFDSHHLLARVVIAKPRAAFRLAMAVGLRSLSLLF